MSDLYYLSNRKLPNSDRTVQMVFDEMNEEQKEVLYYMVGEAIQQTKADIRRKLDL